MLPMRWPQLLGPVLSAAVLVACTSTQNTATALPDSAGSPDSTAAETAAVDVAGDANALAGETAAQADGLSDAPPKPDSATGDTTAPADVPIDADADLVADAATEVAPTDAAAETVAEVADASADLVAADAVAETAADVADTLAKDVAPADASPDGTSAVDASTAACKPGELKRCWVECPQTYAAGCISGQIPILIMGTHACVAGQWGDCDVKHQCGEFANGPCQNGSKAPQNYLCTDGIPMTGAHICTKPLGANCTLSYYINWPIFDCPLVCNGPDDVCPNEGAERDCEVRCGKTTGPVAKGKQKCQNVCNGLRWNMCSTGEACK